MAIKIKHSPSAAAIGGTAYTIGRGERLERDMRFSTEVGLRRASLGLQGRSISNQAKARRDADARQQEELAFRKEQAGASEGRWQDEFDFRKEQQKEKIGLELQKRIDEQERIKKENTIYEYTPGQIKDLERLSACRTRLEKEYAEGKWTLAGLQEGQLQLDHKEKLIIPQARIRTEMTVGQRLKSRTTFDATGTRYIEKSDGNFERQGLDEEGYLKMAVAAAKVFTTQDMRTTIKDKSGKEIDNKDFGKETVDWKRTYAFIDDMRARFAEAEGFAVVAEEEQKRQAEQGQQQPVIEEDVDMQKVISSRQKAIEYVEGVLQEEKYAAASDEKKREIGVKMLKRYGIKVTPDELRTKPERKAAPADRKVAPEVDMNKLDEMAKNRIQQFKKMKDVKWSWVSKKFGQETAAELKYICESGNEQAIANALQRLGII